MGTNFFWFYEIVTLAILIGVTFRSAKKGAVAVIISTAAAVVSFVAAYFGSGIIADEIYNRYISEPLTDSISSSISEAVGDNLFTEIEKIDMSKAVVGGKFLGSIIPEFNSSGKATIDLSDIDLTETGISEADLSVFGIGEDFDYSLVKIGSVEITEQELKDRTLEELVLARVLTANVKSGEAFKGLIEAADAISEKLPFIFKDLGSDVSEGSSNAIYSLIIGITDISYSNYGTAIINSLIDPIVKTPLRIVLFLTIFAVVSLILNLIANASKIINRIPLISSANELLGGVLGLIKAVFILFIICLGVQLLISLTDDSLVFLNTSTIDRTFLFRHIYHFNLIDFITGGAQ